MSDEPFDAGRKPKEQDHQQNSVKGEGNSTRKTGDRQWTRKDIGARKEHADPKATTWQDTVLRATNIHGPRQAGRCDGFPQESQVITQKMLELPFKIKVMGRCQPIQVLGLDFSPKEDTTVYILCTPE